MIILCKHIPTKRRSEYETQHILKGDGLEWIMVWMDQSLEQSTAGFCVRTSFVSDLIRQPDVSRNALSFPHEFFFTRTLFSAYLPHMFKVNVSKVKVIA